MMCGRLTLNGERCDRAAWHNGPCTGPALPAPAVPEEEDGTEAGPAQRCRFCRGDERATACDCA